MKTKTELPLTTPLYSTYHTQGEGGAILYSNPSIKNWYYNQVMMLECNKKFIDGFTTPEITIQGSRWYEIPNIEKKWYDTKYLGGYVNTLIRSLLDDGYYVIFSGVDDYYVKGKSFYKTRHFAHDGLIFGYDQDEKIYNILAYDSNWIYRPFITPQNCFTRGRMYRVSQGEYGSIIGVKPLDKIIPLSPTMVYSNIKKYLDSSLQKYPLEGSDSEKACGLVVHDFISTYLSKLSDGTIPYEHMDWRVMRMIWEHKKVMCERIKLIENTYCMANTTSNKYKDIVTESDNIRMIYASYHIRRTDSLIPILQKKLLGIKESECAILSDFLANTEKYDKWIGRELS